MIQQSGVEKQIQCQVMTNKWLMVFPSILQKVKFLMHFGLNEKDERSTNLQASFSWENKKRVFFSKNGNISRDWGWLVINFFFCQFAGGILNLQTINHQHMFIVWVCSIWESSAVRLLYDFVNESKTGEKWLTGWNCLWFQNIVQFVPRS